ncbi:LOW QUALITY PROTEIN: reverse transcriptase [Phytophthora megakarya]|uniref:Reverse transcriptase n=1 Tax=Phytophthora megakarya TaxID=4795 RepID=A0A225UKM8_9STRA|nr:LOW QUALITY PROTEIN: reverse transcriptase [Phytophthora megakarya]
MDFVTELPESDPGNTYLLLFQDQFSRYVMCKPMRNTEAQDVAEAYEESVFRRFGAGSMIRHDQEPRFMSKVFARFRDLLKSKQRGTLGYRPQANGQQERSVENAKSQSSDWDEHAERLMFAFNTSFDAARLDTPFYLVHGWAPREPYLRCWARNHPQSKRERPWSGVGRCNGTIATLLLVLKNYKRRQSVRDLPLRLRELSDRVKAGFEAGDSVWLYIPNVRTGLSRNLTHLWHGPFRIDEIHDDSRLGIRHCPEYEVEEILDLRWIKRTRTSKRSREYLIKWKNYPDLEWIPLAQLNCGTLLYEFDQGAKPRARFQAMQAGDDHPGN